MIDGDDILLMRPLWLFAIPIAVLVGIWAARRFHGLGGWGQLIDKDLLDALSEIGQVVQPVSRAFPFVPVVTMVLIGAALSGPAERNRDAPSFYNLDGVVLLIDMSRSVSEGGSLDDVQASAIQLLRSITGRPVGLILFTGEPYLVSAMTIDTASIETPISVLAADTMPDSGSRPDRAMAMARGILSDAGIIGGDVVLISDGGGVSAKAMQEAKRIVQKGGRVSTIYIAPMSSPNGMPSPARGALKQIANAGNGVEVTSRYQERLSGTLNRSRNRTLVNSELAPLLFKDLGRYLLVLALLPALLLFRRRA